MMRKAAFSFVALTFFTFFCFTQLTWAATVSVKVSSNNDDAEELISSGNMSRGSSDLEMSYDGGLQAVGIRFQNVAIPQGDSINSAYIEFETDETDSGTTNLVIYGQDTDDAGQFTNANSNITSRTKTTASVNWSPSAWDTVDELHQTADISSIIQEIVNRPGWSSGNDIVIIIEPGAGCSSSACQRTAESHDGSVANAALLVIDHGGGGGGSSCVTYLDLFSSQSYSRQDGTANWATSWTEVGDNGAAGSGDIRISGSALLLEGDGSASNTLGGPYVQREADLSAYTSATLTFDYYETGTWEGNDDIEIYVSDDGGVSWTFLHTFTNDQGSTPQQHSEDITAYISANTRIAFVEKANSSAEDFFFDNVQIEACSTGSPTVDSQTTSDTTPIITGTFNSTGSAGGFTVTVNSVTYTLGSSPELTNSGDDWTLDLTTATPLSIGFYDVVATSDDGAGTVLSDGTVNELEIIAAICTARFRDEFSSASFGNNDGDTNFTGNWDEYEGTSQTVPEASPDPSSGKVTITGGRLRLTNAPGESNNYPGVERQMDLSAFNSATLSFNFYTSGGVDNIDSLLVRISDDGGTSWATLEDITNIGDTSGTRSYDISAYLSSNTRIRFRFNSEVDAGNTGCCYGGPGEVIEFDDINVDAVGTCPSVDHYRIEHTGIGLTCQRSDITIRACEDAACSTEYTGGPVSVDMTPATANPPVWISGDTYSFNTGNTTVELRQTTPATLTLGIANPSPVPANSTQCFVGGVGGSCDIAFFESGFVFDVPDLTACQTSPSVSIQAVRMDDASQTCIANAGFANTSKAVNFWSTYTNPNAGTQQVDISGNSVATSSPGTGISLNFDATATASFTVDYPDAGQVQLDARYDGVGAEETGLVMLGNDSFVSRPVGLCVYSDDADSDCVAGNGTCTEFRKVDESFNLKVKAVCWEVAGDTDFCSGNATTPNYEQSNIPVSHTLVAPTSVGSSAGSIGVGTFDMVDADNGEHVINNQTVSEVGVFTFTATPPDYFGVALPAATSGNIGRFTPDHFITNITANGALENACTGFTYTGQTFGYDPLDRPEMTITATDSGGNTTVNYRDSFVMLTDPTTQINMPAVTADSTTLGADAATPLALSWSPGASSLVANDDGTLDFTLGADDFTYTRNVNALVAPFNTDLQLEVTSITDSDGIVATDLSRFFNPTAIEIRYGQLVLQNAYGPETLPLTLSLSAQYFNGTGFVNNNIDSCTPYDAAELGLSNPQGNISLGDTAASSAVGLQLVTGLGTGMSLSAPGAGNDGSVDLALDLSAATGLDLEWLRPGGADPTAKATFGIYSGGPEKQRLIYMRESVQ